MKKIIGITLFLFFAVAIKGFSQKETFYILCVPFVTRNLEFEITFLDNI